MNVHFGIFCISFSQTCVHHYFEPDFVMDSLQYVQMCLKHTHYISYVGCLTWKIVCALHFLFYIF